MNDWKIKVWLLARARNFAVIQSCHHFSAWNVWTDGNRCSRYKNNGIICIINKCKWMNLCKGVSFEWMSEITITLVSYWDCRWIWLEQNGVNFLDVTSQNQILK